MKNLKKQGAHLLSALSLIVIASCGGDKTSKGCTQNCIGGGWQKNLNPGTNQIDLNNLTDNQQFVVIPYVTGQQNIDSYSDEVLGSVSVKTSSPSLTMSQNQGFNLIGQQKSAKLSFDQADHMIRRILNTATRREVTSLGFTNSPMAWQMQQLSDALNLNSSLQPFIHREQLISFFSTRDSEKRSLPLAMTNKACPDSLDFEFIGVENTLIANDFLEKQDVGGEFCLIVLGEDPQTVADLEKIKSSIATSLANYKLIYDTNFDDTNGNYKFKPVFVLLPFDDDQLWPLGSTTLSGVTGAYFHQLSDDNGQPILILPTDVRVINSELSEEEAAQKFHATIAHELQHAILDYYRFWINGQENIAAIEVGSLDEGLAHYMEDVSGYGEETFPSFAELFLTRFLTEDSTSPILDNNDSPVSRGAAQSLFYYLVSQKGGLSFTDGTVDSDINQSPGLGFLRTYVKGQYHGTAGLFSAYGQGKVETIGQFIGALVTSGSTNMTPPAAFQIQQPIPEVTDTSGRHNRVFGMKFNNFGQIPDLMTRVENLKNANEIQSDSLHYYLPKPFLYKTSQANDSLTLDMNTDAQGLGVTVVRIQ